MFDLKSLVKYLLEGVAVAAAAFYIPRKKTALKDVALIALTAAAVFAVLDMFAPSVALGARQGSGFGIGMTMVGGAGDASSSDADKLQAVKDLVCNDDSSSDDSSSDDNNDSDSDSDDKIHPSMTGGNAQEAPAPQAMQEDGAGAPLEEPTNEPQGVAMCGFSPAPVGSN